MTNERDKSDLSTDVAIIHRYFWPQNYPYALMLRDLAEGMVEHGLNVAIYSSHEPGSDQKEQRERWASEWGLRVRSLGLKSERRFAIWQKVLSATVYAAWVFFVALTCKAKLIWVGSTPPLVMVAMLRLARIFRKFSIVYHCQDVHPEALAINGNVKSRWLLKLLTKIDCSNIRASDVVVTLSEDMRDTISSRPCAVENVQLINNFILTDIQQPSSVSKPENKGEGLLFAGSLGRFQNLEFLTEVVVRLAKYHGVKTKFMGDGPLREKMEHIVKSSGVGDKIIFMGHRSLDEAVAAMQEAAFGLVSLTEGVDRVAYPSKTMMYLAAGLPCVAFVNPQSSLGKMIERECLGIAVSPGGVDEAVEVLAGFLSERNELVRSKPEIVEYAEAKFSKEVVVGKLSRLALELIKWN